MRRGQQRIEHRADHLGTGAAERQVGEPARADGDTLPGQPRDHRRGRWHHLEPGKRQPVDHQGAAAAGGGHHRDRPRRRRRRRLAGDHQRRQLEQGLQHVHAQHAAIAQERVGAAVRTDQRPGMRRRQLAAGLGPPQHVGDDRLAGRRRPPGHGLEAVGPANRLQEQQDRAGRRIVDQHLADLGDPEVGLVAHRHQLGEADAARLAARQQRSQHAAAMRQHPQPSRLELRHFQRRVDRQRHPVGNVDHPHAVRTQQPHPVFARARQEPVLQRHGAGLGEAAGEHADAADSALAAFRHQRRHLAGGDQNVGVVHRLGQLGQRRQSRLAEDGSVARIDRPDRASVAVPAQVAEDPAGGLVRVARGADQRHRARPQQPRGQPRIGHQPAPDPPAHRRSVSCLTAPARRRSVSCPPAPARAPARPPTRSVSCPPAPARAPARPPMRCYDVGGRAGAWAGAVE